jgi:hypothetical protein
VIDWEDVGAKLKSVFSKVAPAKQNIGYFQARWAEEMAGFVDPTHKGEVVLDIASITDIGDGPETRYELVSTVPKEILVGQRRLVLLVKCDSFEHGYLTWCHQTAERIRTFLNRNSVQEDLRASNIALTSIGPSRPASYSQDGRRVNCVLFEVTFVIGYRTTDDDIETVGTIEHIEATAQFKNAGGTVLGEPPNYTDKLMP